MVKKSRQLHLWIGLICSVFILIQAATGLLILEPWLIGGSEMPEQGGFPRQMQLQQMNDGAAGNSDGNVGMGQMGEVPEGNMNGRMGRPGGDAFPGNGNFGPGREDGQGASGFIKNLHQGRIRGTDVSWILSIVAVGMIILTVTGIVMSTKILAAQSSRRNKRKAEL
ncbi:PepSY domain-containing protein [Paenibacillus oenotherae]|uniref:PepSY domain-containing protein n=1 Tax=Paenibacillus oenotherae TaxID=1435645 RepID=A0ABS7DBX7_9BACL|nr:PepSY-associated TM helix domain-containing protein [Paenibacillus oenotherae]MBW7477440.1 PepSY domain-containing protein [Paenibacillus oenotherae]